MSVGDFLKMKYTGKILTLFYAVIQAGISFVVIKISTETVNQGKLSLSITYAVLALILGLVSIGRDHIIIYMDSSSPYNKEKNEHDITKILLEAAREEIEEKKDLIHTITSNLNNTFINCKTSVNRIKEIEVLLTSLNRSAKISNCGNSKLSKTSGGNLLKSIMDAGQNS
ncbi:hypothetical protein [Cedecea davisae]|nr:hypothetical protein [Cedecea davisae]